MRSSGRRPVSCSNPRLTRFVCSLFLLLLTAASVAAAQQPSAADEATVGVLAQLLAASDARRFDPASLREGLSHANPAVRRQAALAAGRIGDGAAVDLLLPVLHDTVPAVQAAAAFALGLLKDARAIPALVATIQAATPAGQGPPPPQVEAVTAIAKIGGDDGARALGEILAGASPGGANPHQCVADARVVPGFDAGAGSRTARGGPRYRRRGAGGDDAGRLARLARARSAARTTHQQHVRVATAGADCGRPG